MAERVAAAVGVDRWRSDLLPEDKVAVVRELSAAGRRVAMVGDGVNDAPALAADDVTGWRCRSGSPGGLSPAPAGAG